jgi:hypothetical protein
MCCSLRLVVKFFVCTELCKIKERFVGCTNTYTFIEIRMFENQNTRSVHEQSLRNSSYTFKVYGSVDRKNIPIYIQQDATLHSLFYLQTPLHVSGGTSTHHQERIQLYLQHLVIVTPLLIPAAIVEELGPV